MILNIISKLSSRVKICSRLLRRSTDRRRSTGLLPVGPSKVKARKSLLFSECKRV